MEEEKFLKELGEKIKKLIDKELDFYSYDPAYFEFKLICSLLDGKFKKEKEIVLLDTEEKNYCEFCGKETRFYDEKLALFLCPSCYGKIKGQTK